MEKMIRKGMIKRRVLVVDDEMINREILGNMLKDHYEVFYAGNGQEALDVLRENGGFSLILLDLLMPVMKGEEVLKICRSDKTLSDIPIIVLTQDEDAEVDSIRAGADDFIKNPITCLKLSLRDAKG